MLDLDYKLMGSKEIVLDGNISLDEAKVRVIISFRYNVFFLGGEIFSCLFVRTKIPIAEDFI